MTRDMDLVRKILIAIAASDHPLDSTLVRIIGYTPDQITDHIRQLHDAKLLDGLIATGPDRRQRWEELRLTWSGHEFVDAARIDEVWRIAVAEMKDDAGTKPFDAWKIAVIKAMLQVYSEGGDES